LVSQRRAGNIEHPCISFAAATLESFKTSLSQENNTLKRSMTDEQWQSLYSACLTVTQEWTDRLREKANGSFPKKVSAFQPEMAVHGKFKQPCPDCGNPVQRIQYASNECNYYAACQNQGNLLVDRSLSRLLKKDWPNTLEELER
jgi:formamidopyrimidine-DNA glycosylase